jgi:hypothetical protein
MYNLLTVLRSVLLKEPWGHAFILHEAAPQEKESVTAPLLIYAPDLEFSPYQVAYVFSL